MDFLAVAMDRCFSRPALWVAPALLVLTACATSPPSSSLDVFSSLQQQANDHVALVANSRSSLPSSRYRAEPDVVIISNIPPGGAVDKPQLDGVFTRPRESQAASPSWSRPPGNSAGNDLWARIRQGFSMPQLDDTLVQNHEKWYATRPAYFQRTSERGSRYLFHIVEEVQRRNMPAELALLPFIESAFNPHALSTASAAGIWQFMPATGQYFELRRNMFRDDRRDVLASTRAALDYLTKLYNMFGDWHLALAAYNWGEGNVSKAIERNRSAGKATDYRSLQLPDETRQYVPKLMAVKNLVSRPESFGLNLPNVPNQPYFSSVSIERDIDLALAVELAGMDREEFSQLNPQFSKPMIPAAGTRQLLLPQVNAQTFASNLRSHAGQLTSWTTWTVPRKMRLDDIAREVGASVPLLREANDIPRSMAINAGSTLLIPRNHPAQGDVPLHLADSAVISLSPESSASSDRSAFDSN